MMKRFFYLLIAINCSHIHLNLVVELIALTEIKLSPKNKKKLMIQLKYVQWDKFLGLKRLVDIFNLTFDD